MNSAENQIIRSVVHTGGTELALVKGDITRERVDAIVNAANSYLRHGGGVAAAISRKGGPVIQQESNAKAPVEVGHATFTSGGNLPAKFVIHTVGPRWGEGDEDNKLASAVSSALDVAISDDVQASSLSLPAISTGIFGFPLDRAVGIILGSIRDWLDENPDSTLKQIRMCLFDQATVTAFETQFDDIFGES
jgi:O-acetyl-ADP-ribose deacetylase (regulator of RNase III)